MSKYITFLTYCVATMLITTTTDAQKTDIDALNAPAFKEKMEKTLDHILLDVRTPGEVKDGVIPGAKVMDFNSSDFARQLDTLDKGETYFVYCKGGGRSSRTVELMKQTGFNHIHELKGGFTDWVKQGYPVVKP
ncbi:MAG: rhodanese-like domain-containing protein [Chryseolinea sp.]